MSLRVGNQGKFVQPPPNLGTLTQIAPTGRGTGLWGIQAWKGVQAKYTPDLL
jgi:hypothetical protein